MNLNELSPQEKAQYKEVASELRCLVCQNQSLADSHASLAVDLKQKIAEQVREGKTNEEIKAFMQARYGEFVIYKPAYSAENAVLWVAPFLVVVLGAVLARRAFKPKSLGSGSQAASAVDLAWAESMYREDQQSHKPPQ